MFRPKDRAYRWVFDFRLKVQAMVSLIAVQVHASKPPGRMQMPSSAVVTLSDPDEYAAAFRNAKVEITVTGRGQFTAELTSIDLQRLQMQRYYENLPRVVHWTGTSERAVIAFRTEPGPSLVWGGAEMLPNNLVRQGEGSNFQRSSGSVSWATMSLPVADMVIAGAAMAGLDLAPPKYPVMLTPSPFAIAKLQRLSAAVGQLAKHAPEIIDCPEAARGLEQPVIEAMVDCLGSSKDHGKSRAQAQHAIVMDRFWQAIEQHPGEPLYIVQICKAIGVSERALRMCCQEYLGTSPKRYLLLRRMHQARRALREAADTTTVATIATQFGFWDLGRFAINYQALFGESPSGTLRRSSELVDHRSSSIIGDMVGFLSAA